MADTALDGIAPSRAIPFFARFRNAGVLAVLLLLVVGAGLFTPQHTFVGIANIKTLLALGSEYGIVFLGIGVLMIAGEFDLSIGSVLAFCSFVFTMLLGSGVPPFLAILVTLACGALIGTLNGLIVVRANIVSFVATLGTMLSWRGLTEILSGGTIRTVALDRNSLFFQLFTGEVGGVFPAQAIWFLLFAAILYLVLNRGRFGNWIYATGDNPQAARAMAIPTGLVKILCFALVGALCAFAAAIQTTRLTAFSVHMGTGWELRAVAAAVVGGTSLKGGRGSMLGIFLGALIIVVVENMVGQARLAYEWTYMVFGLVILGSVLLDLMVEKQIQRAT
jgi:simple sugar transport system permease protein